MFFPLFEGVYNYQVEEDISKLKLCVNSLLQEYSLNVSVKDDYIHELYVLCIVSSQLLCAKTMVILTIQMRHTAHCKNLTTVFVFFICNFATIFSLTSYSHFTVIIKERNMI